MRSSKAEIISYVMTHQWLSVCGIKKDAVHVEALAALHIAITISSPAPGTTSVYRRVPMAPCVMARVPYSHFAATGQRKKKKVKQR
jgi:hypothetical protein